MDDDRDAEEVGEDGAVEAVADAATVDRETGRYLVTHADDGSAVLKNVEDGQVHTLSGNPGVEADEVVTATLAPEPPMAVAWRVVEVAERHAVSVEESPEPPTRQAYEVAADQSVGELARRERAGEGELHVLTLEPGTVPAAVEDVLADEGTLTMAARIGVRRVEVRADDEEGVLSVRYLP